MASMEESKNGLDIGDGDHSAEDNNTISEKLNASAMRFVNSARKRALNNNVVRTQQSLKANNSALARSLSMAKVEIKALRNQLIRAQMEKQELHRQLVAATNNSLYHEAVKEEAKTRVMDIMGEIDEQFGTAKTKFMQFHERMYHLTEDFKQASTLFAQCRPAMDSLGNVIKNYTDDVAEFEATGEAGHEDNADVQHRKTLAPRKTAVRFFAEKTPESQGISTVATAEAGRQHQSRKSTYPKKNDQDAGQNEIRGDEVDVDRRKTYSKKTGKGAGDHEIHGGAAADVDRRKTDSKKTGKGAGENEFGGGAAADVDRRKTAYSKNGEGGGEKAIAAIDRRKTYSMKAGAAIIGKGGDAALDDKTNELTGPRRHTMAVKRKTETVPAIDEAQESQETATAIKRKPETQETATAVKRKRETPPANNEAMQSQKITTALTAIRIHAIASMVESQSEPEQGRRPRRQATVGVSYKQQSLTMKLRRKK